MAYTSTKFQALFAARILPALTVLLERDANVALAEVDRTLEKFRSFRTPTPITTNFPALFVEMSRAELAQSADDSRIDEQHTVEIALAIVGKDAFTVQQRMAQYVLAVDRALRAATADDLLGGVTSQTSGLVLEVTAHDYQLFRVDSVLRADAVLTLVVQFFER